MSRLRKLLLSLGIVLVVVVAVGALAASRGGYEAVGRSQLNGAGAPAWSKPCDAASTLEVNWSACARVEGRIVWVEGRDPDGDGDRHVVLVSRWHPRLVKITRAVALPHPLRIGDRLTAVGPVVLGSHGRDEVDAQSLQVLGPVGL